MCLPGMNGAGKSTVIQSLLVLRQSWESYNLKRYRIQLNGKLAELGTAGEVYCADPTDNLIELSAYSSKLLSHVKIELSSNLLRKRIPK